jgi:hypothetical protein
MSTYSPQELFEQKIAGAADVQELSWNDFVAKLKKLHVSGDALRGFKRFLTTSNNGVLVVKKETFVQKLASFPKISVNSYQGGDISSGVPSFVFIAKSFSVPGFFATKDSQEKSLQNGQYAIRFTSTDKFVFSAEIKNKEGKILKLGIAIAGDKLAVTKDEQAPNLQDLVKDGKSFKGLGPLPYPNRFLDAEEENLFKKLQEEDAANASSNFDRYVEMGIDTVSAYEKEKGN